MFICPFCQRQFESEEAVAKCYLKCWQENNSNHKSKEAPRSGDLFERKIQPEIQLFFNSFGKE